MQTQPDQTPTQLTNRTETKMEPKTERTLERQVGAGFVSLASAYDRMLRGPLPPIVKPLPLLFSEREGGWVVGPPDPPVVSVFLLGDVVLRQEEGEDHRGYGWGGNGAAEVGVDLGVGEAEGGGGWGATC